MPPGCCDAAAASVAAQRSPSLVNVKDLLAPAGIVDMPSLLAASTPASAHSALASSSLSANVDASSSKAAAPAAPFEQIGSSPLLDPIDAADPELMALSGGSLLLEQSRAAGGGTRRRRARTASSAAQEFTPAPLRTRGLSSAADKGSSSGQQYLDAAAALGSASTSSSSGTEGTTLALPGSSAPPKQGAVVTSAEQPGSTSLSFGDTTTDDPTTHSYLDDFTMDTTQSQATFNTTYASVDDSPDKAEAPANVLDTHTAGSAAVLTSPARGSQQSAFFDDVSSGASPSPHESTPRRTFASRSAEASAEHTSSPSSSSLREVGSSQVSRHMSRDAAKTDSYSAAAQLADLHPHERPRRALAHDVRPACAQLRPSGRPHRKRLERQRACERECGR
jgi:hypothetical protein